MPKKPLLSTIIKHCKKAQKELEGTAKPLSGGSNPPGASKTLIGG